MKIRNLDTFYWIASLGSFRAASNQLNLTQPAISARINILEQDLGTPVFVRELRNAELTPDGRKLFPYAKRLMQLEQDVLAAFSETSRVEQTIRLGSSETLVSTWLPDFLGSLSKSQRRLAFDLSVDATDNLRNALVAREIDLAFLMGPVAEVSITNHNICTYKMVFAASPKFAKKNAVWTLQDIATQPLLTFANNTKPSRQIRELLTPHNSLELDMTTSTSLGALIRLATSGYGICAIPEAVISSELKSKKLAVLETAFELPTISFTASYVSDSAASRLMESICKDVKRYLKKHLIKNIYQK